MSIEGYNAKEPYEAECSSPVRQSEAERLDEQIALAHRIHEGDYNERAVIGFDPKTDALGLARTVIALQAQVEQGARREAAAREMEQTLALEARDAQRREAALREFIEKHRCTNCAAEAEDLFRALSEQSEAKLSQDAAESTQPSRDSD